MKNPIVFEEEDYKKQQEKDMKEILAQVPFSIISRDPKIPKGFTVYPKLRIESNRGGIQGSSLVPLCESERFEIYHPDIFESYHDIDVVKYKIPRPSKLECRIEYQAPSTHYPNPEPGFSIRVMRKKAHRTIYFCLRIPVSKLVNALGEPFFNLRSRHLR